MEGRTYTYNCDSCRKRWTSRIGGVKTCHGCGDGQYPESNEKIIPYNCVCGNSWTSRVGGWKKCRHCDQTVHDKITKSDNRRAKLDQSETKTKERVLETGKKDLEENKKKFASEKITLEGEKTKFASEKIAFEREKKKFASEKKEENFDFFFDLFQEEKNDFASENNAFGEKKKKLASEKIVFEKEKMNFALEKCAIEKEKKRFASEKLAFQDEKKKFDEQKKEFDHRKLTEEQHRLFKEKIFQEEKREFDERKKADEASRGANGNGREKGSKNEQNSSTHEQGGPTPHGASARKHEEKEKPHEKMKREYTLRNAQERKEKGNTFFTEGSYELAIAEYTEAIRLAPGVASFYSNRSIAFIKLDRFQEALGDAKKALDLDPACTKAHMRFIQCLLTLGEGMLAERACNDLSGQTPENPEIRKYLKEARHIQKLKNETAEQMEHSSFNEALNSLDQLVSMCPDCIDLRIKKAEVLVCLRRYVDAEKILSDINRDKNPGVLYIRGLSSYNQDKLTKAMEYYKKALSLYPDDTKIVKAYKNTKKLKDLQDSADSYRKSLQYQKAIDIYTEALAVDQNNHVTRGFLLYDKGQTFKLMKKYDEAIREFTRAIEHDSTLAKYYIIRAKCYMKKKNYEAGMDDFDVAYGIDGLPATKRSLEEASKMFEEQESKKTQDYYAILGIERSATQTDVKKAYLRLAKTHHPDRHSSASTLKQRQEERRFKLIGKAYSTLSDSLKRSHYDDDADDFSD